MALPTIVNDELVIPFSRTKMARAAIAAMVFVLIGLWLFFNPKDDGGVSVMMSVIAIILFGACAIVAVKRFLRPDAALIINMHGIDVRTSALAMGFLTWDEIAEMRAYTIKQQVFLGIMPKDLEALLAKQPLWKRLDIRADLMIGAPPISIPQGALPVTVAELLRVIDRRFRRQEPYFTNSPDTNANYGAR